MPETVWVPQNFVKSAGGANQFYKQHLQTVETQSVLRIDEKHNKEGSRVMNMEALAKTSKSQSNLNAVNSKL